MAIKWGSTAGNGRIGINVSTSTSNTSVTVKLNIYVWSKYAVSDSSNTLYVNGSSKGSVTVKATNNSGSGWSSSNQKLVKTVSMGTYTRGTSSKTYSCSAKISGVNYFGATPSVSTSYTIPALAKYTVSYDANGGSGAPGSQTKYYGKDITASSTKPTRTGHTFLGWSVPGRGYNDPYYYPGGNIAYNGSQELVAVWQIHTYQVTYDANGGTGAPGAQTKTYGKTLTLSSTKPTRNLHNFLGWATTAGASSPTYSAGGSYTGNAAVTLYAVWELAYVKPRLTDLVVNRCDADGVVDEDGTYCHVQFKWATDRTVTAITFEIKELSSSTWESHTINATGTSGTVDSIFNVNLVPDKAYNIQVRVADSIDNTSSIKTLPGSRYGIYLRNGGKGVAFGKAATTDGVDFGMRAILPNEDHIDGSSVYGTKKDGGLVEILTTLSSSDNLVIGYGLYAAASGKTNIYGDDVLIFSKAANGSNVRPYYRKGDSITMNLRTAGYITNTNSEVHFLLPLSRPIIGGPTISASSVNGFILRQNNAYTHGSTASVYVKPNSYTATHYFGIGITIIAKFNTTTNSINNSPIGIHWSGTITFS